jgi:hypothetical protein
VDGGPALVVENLSAAQQSAGIEVTVGASVHPCCERAEYAR